jgi:hypothetical protein
VAFDAGSPARDAGAGTLRQPATRIEGVAAPLAVAPVGGLAAAVDLAVYSDPFTVFSDGVVPELEEPHAASIVVSATTAIAHAPLLAPRRVRHREAPLAGHRIGAAYWVRLLRPDVVDVINSIGVP